MRNIKRRTLIKGISSAGLLAASVRAYARPLSGDLAEVAKERIKGLPPDPFEGSIYGVASGDPSESAVTLWCRLPDAIINDVGNVGEIEWWIAETCGNTHQIIASGLTLASQDNDYTVHVRPAELRPDTNYFYGFRIGDLWQSDWGNARTLPAAMSAVERLRLAYFCCQLYGTGYYTAYQALCETQVDFCIHLGDSIYESVGPLQKLVAVRPEPEGTAESLSDYRTLHRRALSDPWYREARRRYTWICIPDDHEVANDYAGTLPATFLRQQSGIQAYLDYMPIQGAQIESAVGPIPVVPYRSYRCGQLATLYALNERQFRVQNSGEHTRDERLNSEGTMLGSAQMEWLLGRLSESGGKPSDDPGATQWNILLSETLMMPFRTIKKPNHFGKSPLESMLPLDPFQKHEQQVGTAGYPNTNDAWDGYAADRRAIVECLAAKGLRNTLVFTGDIHNMYAGQLLDSTGAPVAAEVTTGSISSLGIGDIFLFGAHKIVEALTALSNPHMKAFNLKDHMVMICTLTPEGAEFESHCPATILQPRSSHSVKDRLKVRRGFLEFL
jgi:alkaline phosphatase D